MAWHLSKILRHAVCKICWYLNLGKMSISVYHCGSAYLFCAVRYYWKRILAGKPAWANDAEWPLACRSLVMKISVSIFISIQRSFKLSVSPVRLKYRPSLLQSLGSHSNVRGIHAASQGVKIQSHTAITILPVKEIILHFPAEKSKPLPSPLSKAFMGASPPHAISNARVPAMKIYKNNLAKDIFQQIECWNRSDESMYLLVG